jgi:murein DD-endopeptidase MepM/ murein hydrolase activator NlpD
MTFEKRPILAQNIRRQTGAGRIALVAAVAMPLLGMVAAFGIAPDTSTYNLIRQTVVEDLPVTKGALLPLTEEAFAAHDRVRKGDTVASLLARIGANDPVALTFLRSDATAGVIFRELTPGKSVEARLNPGGGLIALRFRVGEDRLVKVVKVDGEYRSYNEPAEFDRRLVYKTGLIRSSLFAATDAAGVPDGIASQLIKLFGTDIDFHTDLRKGDRFAVIYEGVYDGADLVRTGRLLAAEFVNQGEMHRLVYFEDLPSHGDYYTPGGKSLRKAFLRSPLEFSRISSGFSASRQHPIFNDWRAHKGVDFAAPAGAPVLATSDGKVVFVGQRTGYGNVIELLHSDRYTTVYAHLSGFVSGLRTGIEVGQGEVIGQVGSTGWATGPHLHYEFRINGVHQDPLGNAVPLAVNMSPDFRDRFEVARKPLVDGLDMMRTMASAAPFE